MKVLHLSTWQTGGAAIAATRLSSELNQIGVDSQVLSMSSRFPAYVDAVIGKLTHTTNPIFHSYNYYGEDISQKVAEFKPDIIHIHWIGAGFITPESLSNFKLPIVWTLHDLWPLCGAEHLPNSNRFKDGYLKDNRPNGDSGLDLDRLVWERKKKYFKYLRLTFVSPSSYLESLAVQAQSKDHHKVVRIGNGIDTGIFKPGNSSRKTILFVAMNPDLDPNKGYDDFKQAITRLPKNILDKFAVKVVGGEIKDEKVMSDLYANSAVTVIPSRIENLPFVAMESLACGTPVVAYNVGGIPDLVEHGKNGYLAQAYDIEDLSNGIQKIITSPSLQKEYGRYGRGKIVKSFDQSKIAKTYQDLYESLI